MEQEIIFKIPEKVVNGILNVLASLPYREVAPVMGEINKIIAPQVEAANAKAGQGQKEDKDKS